MAPPLMGRLPARTSWPPAADGAGHSLVLARPDYGENSPLAWSASYAAGGSPGTVGGLTCSRQLSGTSREMIPSPGTGK